MPGRWDFRLIVYISHLQIMVCYKLRVKYILKMESIECRVQCTSTVTRYVSEKRVLQNKNLLTKKNKWKIIKFNFPFIDSSEYIHVPATSFYNSTFCLFSTWKCYLRYEICIWNYLWPAETVTRDVLEKKVNFKSFVTLTGK